MKRIYFSFTLIFLLITFKINAQSLNCENFKNGTFKIIDQGRTTIVKRSGSSQLEYFNGSRVPTHYTVRWVDDCTYILTPLEDVFKKYKNTPKNAILTNKITRTTKNSYTLISTFNFSTKIFTCEVFKIK
jgi:hypothetical protein